MVGHVVFQPDEQPGNGLGDEFPQQWLLGGWYWVDRLRHILLTTVILDAACVLGTLRGSNACQLLHRLSASMGRQRFSCISTQHWGLSPDGGRGGEVAAGRQGEIRS